MREHMERREWSQLGFIVTQKVLEDWTDPEEREDFLRYFHDLPGYGFERIEADLGRKTHRQLFQWCDLVHRTTSVLAGSWRRTRGTEPDGTGTP